AQRASEERARLHSEAEEARAAAVAANRMKDEFLAVLSHELRTPLNAILGWTKLLQRGVLDEPRTAHAIETIERNCKLQAQLVGDLLDVSRIISGTLRLDVQSVDLVQVIEQALATVMPAADAKGVRIQKVLDPSASTVSGDPARLQQVVWNLLSNAVKFTPKNGRIQVHLEWADSNVQIWVSDTGEGIDGAFLPHVFERFRQADASSTRSHGGLGLGLAIVRQLVELHGGSVSVESAGRNQGSTFKVRLPVSLLHRPFPQMHPGEDTLGQGAGNGFSRQLPSLKGMRILVIDDEPESLHVVETALSHCEAEVLTASSVGSALELFGKSAPNIVVCDIGMPREDGFVFARKMRTLEEGRPRWTPAIALTAYARPEDRARILSAGFQVHMVKPVDPFELITVIAGLGKTVG
ncbi:MAG TPA: ATP-binding protein, partial [Nitrospiraceae bacterium]|nr:ATP-binding protein [Nitrospiraceae bacterium]